MWVWAQDRSRDLLIEYHWLWSRSLVIAFASFGSWRARSSGCDERYSLLFRQHLSPDPQLTAEDSHYGIFYLLRSIYQKPRNVFFNFWDFGEAVRKTIVCKATIWLLSLTKNDSSTQNLCPFDCEPFFASSALLLFRVKLFWHIKVVIDAILPCQFEADIMTEISWSYDQGMLIHQCSESDKINSCNIRSKTKSSICHPKWLMDWKAFPVSFSSV